MKYLFKLAAMTALVLPLMMACNSNDPNEANTVGTEAWYRAQLIPNDSAQVPINTQNLLGSWGQYAQAIAPNGKIDKSLSKHWMEDDSSFYPDTLLLLSKNQKCVIYYTYYPTPDVYGWDMGESTDWSLDGDTLRIKKCLGGLKQSQAIIVLEKDRLVLKAEENGCYIYNMFRHFM